MHLDIMNHLLNGVLFYRFVERLTASYGMCHGIEWLAPKFIYGMGGGPRVVVSGATIQFPRGGGGVFLNK